MKYILSSGKLAFEDKLVRIALIGSAFTFCVATYFVLVSSVSVYLKILLLLGIFTSLIAMVFYIRYEVTFQLRTSTNLVDAMASGDFSLRANNREVKGALADFNNLLNGLADRLAQQSLISKEQQVLIFKIISQIDVAIVACNQHKAITLMNPAAEALFDTNFEEKQAWPVDSIGLQAVFDHQPSEVFSLDLPQKSSKVLVRTDTYLEGGQIQTIIFITDIQQVLREEERSAWQKLLRVLSHEINNSLAPIASIAETLSSLTSNAKVGEIRDDIHEHLNNGLQVINERAHNLNHFIQDYQQLAKLPEPNKSVTSIYKVINDVIGLFEGCEFTLKGRDLEVFADNEQIQQVLVNLIKNADEANRASSIKSSVSEIEIELIQSNAMLSIEIKDHGNGIQNTENLFIPFYTTKKKGSGIGLSLSRQILRNHGGELYLINSDDETFGAIAKMHLPST